MGRGCSRGVGRRTAVCGLEALVFSGAVPSRSVRCEEPILDGAALLVRRARGRLGDTGSDCDCLRVSSDSKGP